MSYDTLRVEANERVDYGDFNHAVGESLDAILRRPGEAFYSYDGATVRSWILDGFTMANPSGKQLVVSKGRAILSARINGQLQYGYLLADGDLTKTVDMAPLGSATYNVYVRFEVVDGDNSSRIFWNPAGSGSEFAQTIPTRRLANWSMRVETSNPGAEWVQIGTANNAGVSLVLVDQRPLYFEGAVHQSYQSGWSTDGGGGANDRNADRQQYGVKDLQTFTGSVRQCLEDIKGRGLRRWWDRDIGGMNIGFDAAPVEDRLAIGDAAMYLELSAGHAYYVADAGDYIDFDRSANRWSYFIGSAEEMRLGASGLAIANGLYVGSASGTPVDNELITEGGARIGTGLYVGGTGTVPTDNKVYAEGVIESGGAMIAGTSLNVGTGLYVGSTTGTIEDNNIIAESYLKAHGGRVYFGTSNNTYITADDTNWNWYQALNFRMHLDSDGLSIGNGLYVGSPTGTPTDNDIYAEADITCGGHMVAGTYVQATSYLKAGSYLQVGAATAADNGDAIFGGGINVGFDANPTADTVACGDANFRMDFATASHPSIYFESDTYLEYDRSNEGGVGYKFWQNGAGVAWIRNDTTFGNSVISGNGLFTSSLHNPGSVGTATIINANTSPFCLACCDFDGTLITNTYWNVSNVSHSTGTYSFNFTNLRSTSGYQPTFAAAEWAYRLVVVSNSTNYARVYTYNSSSVLADSPVHVVQYSAQS